MQPEYKIKTAVLVGHCGADSYSLTDMLQRAADDLDQELEILTASRRADIDRHAGGEVLLLVNRVLDGAFGVGDGVELIAQLRRQHPQMKMMLISNFDWAQRKAIEAGALPGFGKSQLYDAQANHDLQQVLLGGVDDDADEGN